MSLSSILWQNNDGNITLLDVPQSISRAQGTDERPNHSSLLSTNPILEPYESNEPKSDAARTKLQSNTVHENLHDIYGALIKDALDAVRQHHNSHWCLERPFVLEPTSQDNKRKRSDAEPSDAGRKVDSQELSGEFLRKLAAETSPNAVMVEMNAKPDGNDATVEHVSEEETIENNYYPADLSFTSNETNRTATLALTPLTNFVPVKYHIPPHSTFSFSNCSTSPFHDLGQKFNLIVLDPPWPNRSVKRTHQNPSGGAYSTESDMVEMRALLKNLQLETLMADDCVVGIWMTNKAAVRELVVGGSEAFFGNERWNLEVLEEWVWLKTTVAGEPVSELGSLWRKPYEVFLIGRRRKSKRSHETEAQGTNEEESASGHSPVCPTSDQIKRRVIISVPDLHSRKPCLKELLLQSDYVAKDGAALEIFARHLVAGWSSWGNECIKFNWEGCWKPAEEKALK